MPVTVRQLKPWMLWVIPSLTDVLFGVLLVSQLSRGVFGDADTGWHLWAGFDVLRHGPRAIPDTLSFTRAGALWQNPEWLADALFAWGYRLGGYFGVSALTGLIYAGLFACLYRAVLRESAHVPSAVVTALLGGIVAVLQLLARPVVFSLALVFAAWELVRVPGRERWALWLLPPLTALWANLHPSAFLAPGLSFFAWLVLRRDRRLLAAAVLSLLALGATPSGYGWLRGMVPTGDNLLLFRNIDEWQTPRFQEPRTWFTLLYMLLGITARRWGPRIQRGEVILGLACIFGTLMAVRLAPIAAILWAPSLARDLAGWARGDGGGRLGRLWRAAQASLVPFENVLRPGLWPALAVVLLLGLGPRLSGLFPATSGGFLHEASYPHRAMAEAESLRLGPRVLNTYGWGGYISWVYGGRWKIFIDGRAGFFSGAALADYVKLVLLKPGWEEALDRWHPDWVLMENTRPLVQAAPLTGRWRVAYRDSLAVILTPEPARSPTP